MDSSTRNTLIAALVPSLVIAIVCICFVVYYVRKYRGGSTDTERQSTSLEEGTVHGSVDGNDAESEKVPRLSLTISSASPRTLGYQDKPITKSRYPEVNAASRIWAQFIHINRSNPSNLVATNTPINPQKNVSKNSLLEYVGSLWGSNRESTLVGTDANSTKRPSLPAFDMGSGLDLSNLERSLRRLSGKVSVASSVTTTNVTTTDSSSSANYDNGYARRIAMATPYSVSTSRLSYSPSISSYCDYNKYDVFTPPISNDNDNNNISKVISEPMESSKCKGLNIIHEVPETHEDVSKLASDSHISEKTTATMTTTTTTTTNNTGSRLAPSIMTDSGVPNSGSRTPGQGNNRESIGGASWIFLSPQTAEASRLSLGIESVITTPATANKRLSYTSMAGPSPSMSINTSRRHASLPRQTPRVASGASILGVAFPALPPTHPVHRTSMIMNSTKSLSTTTITTENIDYSNGTNSERVRSWSHAISIGSRASVASVLSMEPRKTVRNSTCSINRNSRRRSSSIISQRSDALRLSPRLEPATKKRVKSDLDKRTQQIHARIRKVLNRSKSSMIFGPPPRVYKKRRSRPPMRYRCHFCTFTVGH